MNFKELVRIGKDAVTRFTQGGKPVTGFSAAFDNGWGDKKQTVWLDCSLWGERGEKVAPYLLKGSQVVVAGNIGTREHDGKTYITLEVLDVKLVGKGEGKPASERQEPRRGGGGSPAPAADDPFPEDSDIPF